VAAEMNVSPVGRGPRSSRPKADVPLLDARPLCRCGHMGPASGQAMPYLDWAIATEDARPTNREGQAFSYRRRTHRRRNIRPRRVMRWGNHTPSESDGNAAKRLTADYPRPAFARIAASGE